jgi:hypothetical protein
METDSFEPTIEDIQEISKEIEDEVKTIGDINDILLQKPDMEKLKELSKMLESLPREQAAQLLSNLINTRGNGVNPNNNDFSKISEKDIRDSKLKEKLRQKRYARMTKGAQSYVDEKHTKLHENKKDEKTETPTV